MKLLEDLVALPNNILLLILVGIMNLEKLLRED